MELWQLHFKDPVSVLTDGHGQVKIEISFCFYSSVDIVFQGSTAYYVTSHQTTRIADSVCASTRL